MSWLPIIFVCLQIGECRFIYDKVQASEKACLRVVNDMGDRASKIPEVQAWKGTCVPLKYQDV